MKPVMQNTANLCVKCETKFEQWSLYHAHVTSETKCHRQIKPLRTTDRSKGEIVRDWESNNKEVLI